MTKKPGLNRFFLILVIGLVLPAGCAAPRLFWPQKDIVESDVNATPGQHTVLIASRASDYKKELVAELQTQLSAANVSYRTIGITQLEKIDSTDFAAVVVIATCLAWGLDHEVSAFLDSRKTTGNIILHITSGKGSWLPDKTGRNFDAVSGASVKANAGRVARDLLEKILERLRHGPGKALKQEEKGFT